MTDIKALKILSHDVSSDMLEQSVRL